MSDVHFPLTADADFDDLPRTVRREKEARAREARAARERERARRDHDDASRLEPPFGDLPSYLTRQTANNPPAYGDETVAVAVQRFDVPFIHLVAFFCKAAVAAIPALILLAVALYYIARGVAVFYPEFATINIAISVGNN